MTLSDDMFLSESESVRIEAGRAAELLLQHNVSVSVAESLTGGGLCAALVGVPGISSVLAGGVVAYSAHVKISALGVDRALVDAHGTVHPRVAVEMARGVRRTVDSGAGPTQVGIATTGVAGPDPEGGHEPGLVYVGISSVWGEEVKELRFHSLVKVGDPLTTRHRIRESTVLASLRLLAQHLAVNA